MWKMEKNLRMGNQPMVTTMTGRTVVKYVEDNLKQLTPMGIATAYAYAHNVDKLTKTLEQYKGKMDEMKEFLRKEERVCRESKRKYEATLLDYERLQHEYQTLEEERDTLKLSNMNLSKEKGELENIIVELET